MKLGRKKALPGRQRRTSDWHAPAAYSYHAQRAAREEVANNRKSSSVVDKRSRLLSINFWAKRSGYLLLGLIFVICGFSLISLSNQPRIVLLDQGNTYAFQDKAQYQQAVAKQLSSSLWNRNKITVNTGATITGLKDQFPELASARVVLPLVGHRPTVYLTANDPAYVLQSSRGSFVLDADGKALITRDAAPEKTVNTLPVLTDQTGSPVTIGKQVISGNNADFIQTVIQTLKQKNLVVTSLTLPAGSAQELDIKVQGSSYTVKFDMHDSGGVRQQIGTYLATAATLSGQGKTPSQYIDARVSGRVYYL